MQENNQTVTARQFIEQKDGEFSSWSDDTELLIQYFDEYAEIKIAEKSLPPAPTKSDEQFTYFHNHGDEEGRNSITVTYGDYENSDDILITCVDDEKDAIECCKRLNEILSLARQQVAAEEREKQKEFVILSNVQNKKEINIEWLKVWSEVENWYGDPQKKETGEAFLKRMQKTYFIESKVSIPASLEACRLTEDDFDTIHAEGTMLSQVAMTEGIMLEKFAALLSQVEGLPYEEEIYQFAVSQLNGQASNPVHGATLVGKWMRNIASLLLLARDEEHRKEMGRFAEWANDNEWRFYKITYSPSKGSRWIKNGNEKTTDELCDIFLLGAKEKGGE